MIMLSDPILLIILFKCLKINGERCFQSLPKHLCIHFLTALTRQPASPNFIESNWDKYNELFIFSSSVRASSWKLYRDSFATGDPFFLFICVYIYTHRFEWTPVVCGQLTPSPLQKVTSSGRRQVLRPETRIYASNKFERAARLVQNGTIKEWQQLGV